MLVWGKFIGNGGTKKGVGTLTALYHTALSLIVFLLSGNILYEFEQTLQVLINKL